jgi:hypothetical protein
MYDNDLEQTEALMCIVGEGDYNTTKTDILKSIGNRAICLVSFTKPYQALKKDVEGVGLTDKTITYIDTMTMSAQQPPEVEDCVFVESPKTLVDISVAISKMIEEKGKVTVLFDSLSSLMVYHDSLTLTKFLHNIITKIRVMNAKIVFMVLKKDTDSELVKDLCMFVDMVIDTEKQG